MIIDRLKAEFREIVGSDVRLISHGSHPSLISSDIVRETWDKCYYLHNNEGILTTVGVVWTARISVIMEEMQRLGLDKNYSAVSTFNVASLYSHIGLGLEKLGVERISIPYVGKPIPPFDLVEMERRALKMDT